MLCKVTGHEMLPTEIESYISSSEKYKQAKLNDNYDFDKVSRFLTPNKFKVSYHKQSQVILKINTLNIRKVQCSVF